MVLNLPGRCTGCTGIDDAVASAEPGVARHCLRRDRHPLCREGCTAWQSECGCCQGPWGRMDEDGVSFECKLDGNIWQPKKICDFLNEFMSKIYIPNNKQDIHVVFLTSNPKAGVLEALVAAISTHSDLQLQQWAAGALGNICALDVGTVRDRAAEASPCSMDS